MAEPNDIIDNYGLMLLEYPFARSGMTIAEFEKEREYYNSQPIENIKNKTYIPLWKQKVDNELNALLRKIKDDDFFVQFIFDYCESQDDRKRLLEFIKSGHDERKEVLLMASQIGIESGNVEGEFEDE